MTIYKGKSFMVIFVMYLNLDVCIFMVKFTNKQKIRIKLGVRTWLASTGTG